MKLKKYTSEVRISEQLTWVPLKEKSSEEINKSQTSETTIDHLTSNFRSVLPYVSPDGEEELRSPYTRNKFYDHLKRNPAGTCKICVVL